ncbi:putative glutamate--cysteine ligase 2 [Geodermatophilus obscurus DSM 43160]|uniref:Carboxylate-amine ligase n=1 Tax=Geodermatophilus obscurus (strain ATCC 25078 / DSM 43160 / JCM 3152 / CCUG 61914 / KCC A-0152 / KCTC 9177 / NBRC 13315 / NRRL B-3577 / G-20) TaxID=526225 RepID=D2SD82_GEOOG|nr:carboxylate-amine ligase [Geodermatophilus obscurus DSM 43160]
MSRGGGPGTEPGVTVGVEEEFHLVDPDTLVLTPGTTVVAAALAGDAGEHVHPEIVSTQLETSTGVCATLPELRTELSATRAEAAAAAARDGLALLAASTHPFGTWREQRLTAAPRYRDRAQR